ncbi:MAG: hypothetical protein NC087_01985 [Anaeroplasma bactoclasticum]|nr:hypothetical protein [Anaeroplasma bactoclasticum]
MIMLWYLQARNYLYIFMTLLKANAYTYNYKYLNVEPNHEKLQDCVIRAITLATAIPYDDVVQLLYDNGEYNNCDEICLTCYEKLLETMNYVKLNANNLKVGEIAWLYPNKVLLIRIEGHLTCSIDGCVYDIWDCTDKEADCYWIIE